MPPQPSSTQAVRTTARTDLSSAVLQCGSIQDQPRCKASGHAPMLQAGCTRAKHLTANDRLSSTSACSFWIVETIRCNRVMASSTCHCHHQPIRSHLVQTRGSALTAAPPGDRTDCERAAGPAGHVMSISEDRLGCELQSNSPRNCSEGVVWLDAITQHERCDLSRHAGGTSYSVTRKTARITGITVRGDLPCRSPGGMPHPAPVPSAKKAWPPLRRRSRTHGPEPASRHTEVLRRLMPRAPIAMAGGPCRSAAQRGIGAGAADELTSK